MKSPIQFGTDGWRAGIAEAYTFENVRIVAAALAAHLKKQEKQKVQNGVAIGYDTRFLSQDFARAAAETIAAAGIPVHLAQRDCPTPVICWTVRNKGMAGGVMITASHNPPRYNGFKFFMPNGSSAATETTKSVESLLGRKHPVSLPAPIDEFDPHPDYVQQLQRVVDVGLLKKAKGKAVCDCVHGVGRGYLDAFLRDCDWRVTTIRAEPDPMFGGILPDPANPACHKALQEAVAKGKADLGLANDPDADRFGIVDSIGEYLSPNQVLPLLYVHMLEHRGIQGPIARTVATTHLLNAIAERHHQTAIETPVGFKWIAEAIESQGAILGGEESGGLSISGHEPNKDGILADLLIAEVWAVHRKPLSEVFKGIMKKYGAYYSSRIDLHLDPDTKDALMGKMEAAPPTEVAGSKVVRVVTLDGIKLNLADESWLLMRPSGTEPLVRVYLEARTKARLKELTQFAQGLR